MQYIIYIYIYILYLYSLSYVGQWSQLTIWLILMLVKQCHKPPIFWWFIPSIYADFRDGFIFWWFIPSIYADFRDGFLFLEPENSFYWEKSSLAPQFSTVLHGSPRLNSHWIMISPKYKKIKIGGRTPNELHQPNHHLSLKCPHMFDIWNNQYHLPSGNLT